MTPKNITPQLAAYLKLDIPAEAKRVAQFVNNNPNCNRNDVCKGMGIGIQSASGRLADCQRLGLISKTDTVKQKQSCYVYEPDINRRATLAATRAQEAKEKGAKSYVKNHGAGMPEGLRTWLLSWSEAA